MNGTKEFHDIQENFEKNINYFSSHGHIVKRDNSGIKGIWYTDGYINDLFRAFMMGYQFNRVNNL